jgi:hypothetical protein
MKTEVVVCGGVGGGGVSMHATSGVPSPLCFRYSYTLQSKNKSTLTVCI